MFLAKLRLKTSETQLSETLGWAKNALSGSRNEVESINQSCKWEQNLGVERRNSDLKSDTKLPEIQRKVSKYVLKFLILYFFDFFVSPKCTKKAR